MATTIQVQNNTLDRLKYFKEHGKESYDEVINKLIDNIEEGELSEETMEGISRGIAYIKAKKTKPIDEVARKFGVKL